MIAAPNPTSLSGVVTKHTPHWFHIWYYRHVMGSSPPVYRARHRFPRFSTSLSSRHASFLSHGSTGSKSFTGRYESPRYPEMRALTPALAALLDGFATILNLMLPSGLIVTAITIWFCARPDT